MLDNETKHKINRLWNAFWAGGLSNPLTAIEQISYLIFMKRLDDLDTQHKNAAYARKENHKSVFSDNEDCRWSVWKFQNAETMFNHVTKVVFPFIKNIHNGNDTLYSRYMKDAAFMIPKPSFLQEAVSLVDSIDIVGARPDIQGDIYEHLLGELNTAGKNGQFRTPRHIIRMMVELVDPDLGQRICDPACGTGGFLVGAYQYIIKKYTTPDMIKRDPDGTLHNLIGDKIVNPNIWKILNEQTFYGVDFEITMVRIAMMNMILHGILQPNIQLSDSLSKGFEQDSRFDIILANPPFSGYIDKSDINDNFSTITTKTELLFLELFYNLLSMGGKGAVIVPNGVLFGSSNAHIKIRKTILENCDLKAVISLPSGVFLPYSGVGTSILIFIKGGKTENTWFYEMTKDGYSLDQKRNFIDGVGDISDVVTKFNTKEISEKSLNVPLELIRMNGYNLFVSNYKKEKNNPLNHENPKDLVSEALEIEEQIESELKKLREMI